jgi:copper/silver efflux system protein
LERLAREIEAVVRTVPGTTSAFAERVMGGYYLNVEADRSALARYGLMIADLQEVIRAGLGAEAVTTTVEGRERYTVNVRYPQAFRSSPQSIAEDVLVPLPNGGSIPLGQIAKIELAKGPASIRTENAQLVVYIFVDFRDRDIGGYVADARKAMQGR